MLAIQEVALFTLPFETQFLAEFGLAGWQTAVIFLPLSLLSLGLSYSARLFILVQPHELRSSITHKSFTYITVSQFHLFPPKPAILQAGGHTFQAVCQGIPLACYSYAYPSRFREGSACFAGHLSKTCLSTCLDPSPVAFSRIEHYGDFCHLKLSVLGSCPAPHRTSSFPLVFSSSLFSPPSALSSTTVFVYPTVVLVIILGNRLDGCSLPCLLYMNLASLSSIDIPDCWFSTWRLLLTFAF